MNQSTTDKMILDLLSRSEGWKCGKQSYDGGKELIRTGIRVYLFYMREGPFWRSRIVPNLGYDVDGNACNSTVKGRLPESAEHDFLARFFERASARIAEVSGMEREPMGSRP